MQNYSLVSSLTRQVVGELGGGADDEAAAVADVGLHEPIAIVGIAGRFPGGPGNSNHIDESPECGFQCRCTGIFLRPFCQAKVNYRRLPPKRLLWYESNS